MLKTLLTIYLASAVIGASHGPDHQQQPSAKIPGTTTKGTAVVPTVDEIIDKYLQTCGGKDALSKLSTRMMKGEAELAGVSGKGEVVVYNKAPDKMMANLTLPTLGHLQYGYDGHNGWRRDPTAGFIDIRGLDLTYLAFDSDFYKEIRIRQRYSKLELKGLEKNNGRDVYLIIGTPVDLKPEKLYFDTHTGLLVRLDTDRETAEGRVSEQVEFEDYRMVGAVNIPFVERHTTPSLTIVFRFTSVHNNVPIDDAIFSKPSVK